MPSTKFQIKNDFPPTPFADWMKIVEKDLDGAPFEKRLVTKTYEGIDVQPLYCDENDSTADDPAGVPGFSPFIRGARALGNVANGWEIRQEHENPSPAENNAAILTDLERGVSSILLRLDRAACAGLDSDDPGAADLAGVDGIMMSSANDMKTVLNGVLFDIAPVGLDAGAEFIASSALLYKTWKDSGIDLSKVVGSFNADPLRALAREGNLPMSVDEALNLMTDLAVWTSRNLPKVTSVLVSTRPYHYAGATATQDLAFSMATGLTYLRRMVERGMDIEEACKQIDFSYSVGCNQFLAISKLRAARGLWARVVEACGGSPEAQAMKMRAYTSKRVLTIRDPWVNILRATVGCFAAAVAGADCITVPPFDSALGLSDNFSRRIARNTQIILQEESHLNRVVDPAGGGWYVEKLTNQLAEKAWEIFQEIEKIGGMPQALQSGWIAEQIDGVYASRLENIGKRKDALTGVSEFPNLKEEPLKARRVDLPGLRIQASDQLIRIRKQTGVVEALKQATAEAHAAVKLEGKATQAAIDAVENGATLGVVARSMVGSDCVAIEPLALRPYGEPYEALRAASDEWMEVHGRHPQVFLANMGPVAKHTARAGYARNFFAAGGFDAQTNKGFKSSEEAVEAFKAGGARIAVICSSDDLYPQIIPDLVPKLKAAGADTVILAGRPGENKDAWREAGVDKFIYLGCDVLETLRSLLQSQGVVA